MIFNTLDLQSIVGLRRWNKIVNGTTSTSIARFRTDKKYSSLWLEWIHIFAPPGWFVISPNSGDISTALACICSNLECSSVEMGTNRFGSDLRSLGCTGKKRYRMVSHGNCLPISNIQKLHLLLKGSIRSIGLYGSREHAICKVWWLYNWCFYCFLHPNGSEDIGRPDCTVLTAYDSKRLAPAHLFAGFKILALIYCL